MAAILDTKPIATRLRKKRDLETTMNNLKQLLEPSITVTTKKGSRKKNKPRSLPKVVPSNKTISRKEICSKADGEYYPNKLKRTVRSKKTILKPTHQLKVVVTTNKRKRCTPHKGIELLHKESPPSDINIHTAPDNTNIHSAPNVFVHTEHSNVNVHTEPNKNMETFSNIVTATLHGNKDIHNGNVQTIPDNLNVHTTNLEIHTPPISDCGVVKYDLVSPPHKSLTQLTTDDLIRMDEDSLCEEDLMEILTCPSPVWWEDPDESKGSLCHTKGLEISINKNKSGKEYTMDSSNKGIRVKEARTVSVTKCKANKIAKLENILGHIKSLVQNNDKLISPGVLKNNDNLTNDGDNDNVNRTVDGEDIIMKDNDDKIVNETSNDDIYKSRTISSSGSDISVNDEDLLRNLECINIPIQCTDGKESDVIKDIDKSIDNDIIPIDNKEIDRRCDEAEQKSLSSFIEKTLEVNKCDERVNIMNKQKKLNTNKSGHSTRFKESKRKKSIVDTNEKTAESKTEEEMSSELKHKSILKKLKQQDDILDVKLIKTPTNVTNEVKIWSKLDNFKRHNFKPQDFDSVSEVIDVEEELQFSIIESRLSPAKELDPLDIKNETILIDDDSNDGLDTNSSVNIIESDAIEQLNDITITAITGNYESSHEVAELNVINVEASEQVDDDDDVIKEDTIRIGNVLDVRLIETSDDDTLLKLNRKRKSAAGLSTPRKQYANNAKKNKNTTNIENKLQSLKQFPIKTIESLEQSLNPNIHQKYIEQINEDSNNKNNSLLNIINSANVTDILRLNDLDVSLVASPSPKKDENNDENNTKNDLSITFVNKTEDISIVTAPMVLPTLIKNPTKLTMESPKSVISSNSESTVELSEGTISDTNIQFLDEYEDNKSVYQEELDRKSESELEERDTKDKKIVEEHNRNIAIDADQNADSNSVVDIESENKSCQEDIKTEEQYLDTNENNKIDDESEQKEISNEKYIENCDKNEDNKSINSQDFDEEQNTDTNKEELITIYKIISNTDKDEKATDNNDENITDNLDIG